MISRATTSGTEWSAGWLCGPLHLCSNIEMVQVVAAILERNGEILIGQRMAAQSHPLQWEFPGGKVEPGETPDQALARELEEELGIRGSSGQVITEYQYTYAGKDPIILFFYRVLSFTGEPRNLVFRDLRWVPPAQLPAFDFVEGDRDFIRNLAGGAHRAGSHE